MLTIPKEKLPTHIACIMDGNGRWANSRHLPRQAGHRAGADTVERCADFCMAHDIPWLTLYAFSSENWNRPKTEVRALMLLLHEFLKKRLNQMMEKGVRLHAIGDLSRIPARTRKLLQDSLEATSGNTRLNLVLAISYGSRGEIAAAARKIAEKSLPRRTPAGRRDGRPVRRVPGHRRHAGTGPAYPHLRRNARLQLSSLANQLRGNSCDGHVVAGLLRPGHGSCSAGLLS